MCESALTPAKSNVFAQRSAALSLLVAVAFCIGALNSPAIAQDRSQQNYIVKARHFRPNEVYCKGFRVLKPTSVQIQAVGARSRHDKGMAAYAWILRSGTLRPVWVMDATNSEKLPGASKVLYEYDSWLELEQGDYEAYFYAGSPDAILGFKFSFDLDVIKELLSELRKELKKSETDLRELEKRLKAGDYSFVIDPDDLDFDVDLYEEYRLEIMGNRDDVISGNCSYTSDRVIAEILRPENDEYASVGFTLAKPLDVQILAIGEAPDWSESYADYGWILDADTRERVWSMEEARLSWAGGADKNKMAEETIELDKGNYLLFYVTDDSHTFDNWNAAPPYKPDAYGVRVSALTADDLKYVKPYEDSYAKAPLLAIVRAGDDWLELKPFVVKRDCEVRVYAIGEYTGNLKRDGDWADYGWIERAGDRQLFWEMKATRSQPAGGARKNRQVDETIRLPKGEYVLGYLTDDSHSYGNWNSPPPYDQKNYGISLFGVREDFDRSIVQEITEASVSKEALVSLTRIGDNAKVHQEFSLKKPTRVNIFAVGEGIDGQMFDFGWIEDTRSGNIIWEMTYRKTRPAGGHTKNRQVDATILLDAGTYRAVFVTDGSHSYAGWNAPKPRQPQQWGLTITAVNGN